MVTPLSVDESPVLTRFDRSSILPVSIGASQTFLRSLKPVYRILLVLNVLDMSLFTTNVGSVVITECATILKLATIGL